MPSNILFFHFSLVGRCLFGYYMLHLADLTLCNMYFNGSCSTTATLALATGRRQKKLQVTLYGSLFVRQASNLHTEQMKLRASEFLFFARDQTLVAKLLCLHGLASLTNEERSLAPLSHTQILDILAAYISVYKYITNVWSCLGLV